MGLDVAASFPQALTSWHLLHNVSVTKPGEIILLHAIGGGVGLIATQLAARASTTVIGTVGTRGKERRALEFGAAKVPNREDEDFVAAVMARSSALLSSPLLSRWLPFLNTSRTMWPYSKAELRRVLEIMRGYQIAA
jgi:D-arabinose 1-dehydrogenase-like Zn-dependent alcohol dehydrogenase